MKILFFANTDWYLFNFRLALAQALKAKGNEVVLVSPPGIYGERLEQAGFRWVPFPFSRRGANPIEEIGTIIRLASLYKTEKPGMVHHFTVKCVLYGTSAARLAGVGKIFNSITGLGYVFIGDENRARWMRFIVEGLYKLIIHDTQVIFQNEDDRQLFVERGLVKTEQTSLIMGSGVDTNHFLYYPEPNGEVLVVLPGRMLYAKGVSEFVEAAHLLHREGYHARFILVGISDGFNPDGVPVSQLEKWQQEGEVEWWGWQDDMAGVYQLSHIVCLPSYREGLPRALLEAAACGRAAVASDMPGCREVVRDGENGLLVHVRDPRALADAIRDLLIDPQRRRKMGLKGREIVENEFSSEMIVEQTLRLYNQNIFNPDKSISSDKTG